MSNESNRFVKVILPLKLSMEATYSVPDRIDKNLNIGWFVTVPVGNTLYRGVVSEVEIGTPEFKGKIKEIVSILDIPPVQESTLIFWRWVSDYYMCTVGEVYKAALGGYSPLKSGIRGQRSEGGLELNNLKELSGKQSEALNSIQSGFTEGLPVLLKGVTGSGKTEIYIHLSAQMLQSGKSVLYMVPEIALSRQLQERLSEVFKDKLLVYHSRQSQAKRREIIEKVSGSSSPVMVLGLRSSVLLPFRDLGLIIIDEEHDQSYKQSDPAPRYNGRDCALMLARIFGASTLLGSATPSFETIYNCHTQKYRIVELTSRYYTSQDPLIKIVDTRREEQRGKMRGLFPLGVLETMSEKLDLNEQILVFRNRRSYSPFVQCLYCGAIPMCKHCNVSLSYHKGRNSLQCHYCNFTLRYNTICTECGKPGLKERGCGTEMIEEQLKAEFPKASIARFDSETTSGKNEAKRILQDFTGGKCNILVGTQMISKGFDFKNLTLIVIVNADSLLYTDDFRATEKAMQMLIQLTGRGGRREKRGTVIVLSGRPDSNIYSSFKSGDTISVNDLNDRKEFGYPPFARLIKLVIKERDREALEIFAGRVKDISLHWGADEVSGPVFPVVDKILGEYILNFWIKIGRGSKVSDIKKRIYDSVAQLHKMEGKGIKYHFDADPL